MAQYSVLRPKVSKVTLSLFLRIASCLSFCGVVVMMPSRALAAAEPKSADLATVALILFCIGASYILAHLVVDRLQSKLFVLSGSEYLALGVLLGPLVPQLRVFDNLTHLLPLIALATGWIGLLRGMELELGPFERLGATRIAISQAIATVALVGISTYALIYFGPIAAVPWRDAMIAAGVCASCGVAAATEPLNVVSRVYQVEGDLPRLLRRTARLSDLLAIVLLGALFCAFHKNSSEAGLRLTPTEWGVVAVAIGVLLGIMFRPFLGGDQSPAKRLLALAGVITFASGAAAFLTLPALLVNLLLGMTLVNASRDGQVVREALESTLRPMNIVLLIFAGALWRPVPWQLWALGVPLFVGLRMFGKALGGGVAAWGTDIRNDVFRAMMGHGPVSVAILVTYRLTYEGPVVDLVYSVLVTAVVLQSFIAPRLLRTLLMDAGEIASPQERLSTA